MKSALSLLLLVLLLGCQPGPQEPAPTPKPTRPPGPRLKTSPENAHLYEGLDEYVAAFPEKDYEVAESAGYKYYVDTTKDAIKDVLRAGDTWEPHVQERLRAFIKSGDVVLDVGAHIGTHTTLMDTLVGAEGKVYAWEPQRKLYRELVQNLKLNGCTHTVCLRTALGASSGVVEMNPMVDGNEGGTGVGKDGESVELRTLDSYHFPRIDLLKIDVEGFEGPVIQGATETILRTKPIILLEIMGGSDYKTASPEIRRLIEHTRGLLAALGYRSKQLWHHDYLALPFRTGTDRLRLDLGTKKGRPYLGEAFFNNEFDEQGRCTYVWTRGEVSTIKVPLVEVTQEPYVLGLRARAYHPLAPLQVDVSVNGASVGQLSMGEQWGAFDLQVPFESLKAGENVVELRPARQASPAEIDPQSGDKRRLGVGVDLLWLTPEVLEP